MDEFNNVEQKMLLQLFDGNLEAKKIRAKR